MGGTHQDELSAPAGGPRNSGAYKKASQYTYSQTYLLQTLAPFCPLDFAPEMTGIPSTLDLDNTTIHRQINSFLPDPIGIGNVSGFFGPGA